MEEAVTSIPHITGKVQPGLRENAALMARSRKGDIKFPLFCADIDREYSLRVPEQSEPPRRSGGPAGENPPPDSTYFGRVL